MVSIFERKIEDSVSASTTIRAIVPVLDEAERLESALLRLRDAGVDFLVVVDGGSRDRSLEIAHCHADLVKFESRGLASQLNRGAEGATEEVLFFHYADAVAPPQLRAAITRTLTDPRALGGAFRLQLEPHSPLLRFISWGANLRTLCGLGPFGDQGIFVRRSAFEAVGGYCPDQLLEDLDLVRRLRRLGAIRVQREVMFSSARRWQEDGHLRTTFRHWRTLALHLLGRGHSPQSQASYARWRRGGRGSPPSSS